MTPRLRATCACTGVAMLLAAGPARAQEPEGGEPGDGDATELAKETQNPVADLISIPLQFNFNSGGALGDRSMINLNIQPVVPINMTARWNLIARPIIPLYNIPEQLPPNTTFRRDHRDNGLGDIVAQLFLTPRDPGKLVWGLGPVFSLPTATLDAFTTGSWGLGPAGLVVYTTGPWVLGVLATQTWTFADYGDDRDVNLLLVQPFVNFNFGKGWALSSAPIITASWNAPGDDTWTVPLGGGLTWTTKIGSQALNLGVQYFYNVERPDTANRNQLRFVLAFLFPRDGGKKKSPAVAAGAPACEPGAVTSR